MIRLRAGTAVAVGPVRIVPLERVQVEGAAGGGGLLLYASKTPVGLVISTPGQDRAMDLQGNPIPLPEGLGETEGT